ncbi:MAG: hypothetical protein ACPHN3_08885 [Spongiibacter sp.]
MAAKWFSGWVFLWLLLCAAVAQGAPSQRGFLDFNLYPYLSDASSDSVATLNVGAQLPQRLSLFMFINFYNAPAEGELTETTTFYSEQTLKWQISDGSPFDLTVQSNLRSGEDNDRLRFGARWRFHDTPVIGELFKAIHLSYSINFHAIQIDERDESVWQMEHAFRMGFPWLSERLYLGGFIDHTFNETLPEAIPANPMVAEAQLGWRLVEDLYLVAEYRLNQYRRSDVNNLALGLEYKILW